jgi:YfiH family protein
LIRHKTAFPDNVSIVSTSRYIDGGKSVGRYSNFNLGIYVGDDTSSVQLNRDLLSKLYKLPSEPRWLKQVHSSVCVDDDSVHIDCADASVTTECGLVCVILTADCLPIFACSRDGERVGVAHAGWKGIVNGVIESFVDSFNGDDLLVHFGPAISKSAFEVGDDVYQQFIDKDKSLEGAFIGYKSKYKLDIYQAARIILNGLEVRNISGGDQCTYKQDDKYFSYRRDGTNSGRMAHLIWRS